MVTKFSPSCSQSPRLHKGVAVGLAHADRSIDVGEVSLLLAAFEVAGALRGEHFIDGPVEGGFSRFDDGPIGKKQESCSCERDGNSKNGQNHAAIRDGHPCNVEFAIFLGCHEVFYGFRESTTMLKG